MKFRAALRFLRLVVIFALTQQLLLLFALGQTGKQKQGSKKSSLTVTELSSLVPAPRREDVASPKAVVLALHASISGPMGPFSWDRFRSLFLPTATIGEAGLDAGGKPYIKLPVEDWILSVQNLRSKVSVHETVYKVHIEQFGITRITAMGAKMLIGKVLSLRLRRTWKNQH